MKCMVYCIRVVNVYDIWMQCMCMQANLPHCCWIGENKSMTAAEDMGCKSSYCEVEVLMNFRLEK